MLKWIESAPALPLASVIAWRSDPAPESVVFGTVRVAPETAAARRRSDAAVGATRRVRRFDLGPTRLASLMTAPPLVRWKFDRTLAPGTKDFDRKRGKSR